MEHHWPAILRHDAFDEDVVVSVNIPEQSSDLLGMLTAVICGYSTCSPSSCGVPNGKKNSAWTPAARTYARPRQPPQAGLLKHGARQKLKEHRATLVFNIIYKFSLPFIAQKTNSG
jgi:hypothetical protein